MAENAPQNNQKGPTLAERLRSYEQDVARWKNLQLNPFVPAETPTVVDDGQNIAEALRVDEETIRAQTAQPVQVEQTYVPPVQQRIPDRVIIAQQPDYTRNIFIGLVVVAALIVVGLGGYYVVTTYSSMPAAQTVAVRNTDNLIATQSSKDIVVKKDESLSIAMQTVQAQPPTVQGALMKLIVKEEGTDDALNATDFLTRFSSTVPDYLARSFTPLYVAGFYNNGGWKPVFIFTTEDHATTFAGMIAWEPTLVREFNAFSSTKISSTSTPLFKDISIATKPARAAYDAKGNLLAVYGFYNPSILVIAADQQTYEEIFARLATSNTKAGQ